jgi:hypothetical protein
MATIVETTTNPEMAPPCYAGRKRPHALTLPLVIYDHATAAQHAQRKTNISANAGTLVPFMAGPPIDAVPLAAAAPSRAEPSWIRTRLFRQLGIRVDMEVRFIGEKTVTDTDLDKRQNRFRLPNDGVQHTLMGMISDAELKSADLLHEDGPRPRPPKQARIKGENGGNKMKSAGKKHVGLPVVVVDADGRRKQMKLKQWESSRSTVIHGDGYRNFVVEQCGFKLDDVVEIWAFREKQFRYFGVDMCVEGPLHILIAKKEQQLEA